MSDDDNDLFGSDDDDEQTTTTTTTTTTSDAAPPVAALTTKPAQDESLFGSDEEDEEPSAPAQPAAPSSSATPSSPTKPIKPPRVINIALRPVTSFAPPNATPLDVIQPGQLYVNPHCFERSKYDEREEEKAFEDGSGNAAPRRAETVRWRETSGGGVGGMESNARVVKWSDGTMSFVVGDSFSEVTQVPTPTVRKRDGK